MRLPFSASPATSRRRTDDHQRCRPSLPTSLPTSPSTGTAGSSAGRCSTADAVDRPGPALIQAAAALLERSNGDGFTVQDVADEAGQSLRTLYQYFESKDDLLLAVFEEAMGIYAG